MNKNTLSLICLAIALVTMPACRKKSRAEKKKEKENISTLIETDGKVEEKEIEKKQSIYKF